MRRESIRNGRSYPLTLRTAAVLRSQVVGTSAAAREFNISKGAMCDWRRIANVQGVVPPGIAMHIQRTKAAIKHSQPQVQEDGTILFNGRVYR